MVWAGNRSLVTESPLWSCGLREPGAPEETSYSALAPRLGIAYGLDSKTVIRTGYGIFYLGSYYPGWGGGAALDGFMTSQSAEQTSRVG